MRIVVVRAAWQPVLRRQLSRVQLASLPCFAPACLTKAFDQFDALDFTRARAGLLVVMAMIPISVLARVGCELLLKELRIQSDLQSA